MIQSRIHLQHAQATLCTAEHGREAMYAKGKKAHLFFPRHGRYIIIIIIQRHMQGEVLEVHQQANNLHNTQKKPLISI